MKLTLMLWTTAAAAAVTVQLLAAASLEMEEKELEDALATREVEVEKRGRRWEARQQMILLDAMGDAFMTLLRLAKRLSRKGKGRRRGKGRKFKEYNVPVKSPEERAPYDEMPFKRFLEGPGGDAEESVAEQNGLALCRDFLNSQEIGEAAGPAKRESKELMEGKQEEIQEEGKQDESQEEADLKDLVQTQRMLELCLELMP